MRTYRISNNRAADSNNSGSSMSRNDSGVEARSLFPIDERGEQLCLAQNPSGDGTKRIGILKSRNSAFPESVTTKSGARLTFCQPSTSGLSNSQVFQNCQSTSSNFERQNEACLRKRALAEETEKTPYNSNSDNEDEQGFPFFLAAQRGAKSFKSAKMKIPDLLISPPEVINWSPVSLKTPDTKPRHPSADNPNFHISPMSFFYVRSNNQEPNNTPTGAGATSGQYSLRFSGIQMENRRSAHALTTMARLEGVRKSNGRPVNRILELSFSGSCSSPLSSIVTDPFSTSALIEPSLSESGYASASFLDTTIEKIETPSKGLENNIENCFAENIPSCADAEEMEVARKEESYFPYQWTREYSSHTTPLKENSLFLNSEPLTPGAGAPMNLFDLPLDPDELSRQLTFKRRLPEMPRTVILRKSPGNFSPIKRRKSPSDGIQTAPLEYVETVFGKMIKGQHLIVEWEIEEDKDNFCLDRFFGNPSSQEYRNMVGESEEQLEITTQAHRFFHLNRATTRYLPFRDRDLTPQFSCLPSLALINSPSSYSSKTLSMGLPPSDLCCKKRYFVNEE